MHDTVPIKDIPAQAGVVWRRAIWPLAALLLLMTGIWPGNGIGQTAGKDRPESADQSYYWMPSRVFEQSMRLFAYYNEDINSYDPGKCLISTTRYSLECSQQGRVKTLVRLTINPAVIPYARGARISNPANPEQTRIFLRDLGVGLAASEPGDKL